MDLVMILITAIVGVLATSAAIKAKKELIHLVAATHIDEILVYTVVSENLDLIEIFLDLPLQSRIHKMKFLDDKNLITRLLLLKPVLSRRKQKTIERFERFLADLYYSGRELNSSHSPK